MLLPLVLGLAGLAVGGLLLNAWAERQLLQPDAHYPPPTLPPAAPGVVRLVCAGDSLTHGNMSAPYVPGVAARLAAHGVEVFNAGINADLAETLLARLDDVVAARPDFVSVLIGTNDINAALSPADLARYRSRGKLRAPEPPSPATFRRHLTALVHRLRAETPAQVALISLPPLGENLDHDANRRANEYSAIIREVARAEGVAYLPLREQLLAELRARPGRAQADFGRTTLLIRLAMLRHYLLGHSWDRIAARLGHRFLTDNLHLNGPAAAILADLVASWVERELALQPAAEASAPVVAPVAADSAVAARRS